jgi:hypothetical protein
MIHLRPEGYPIKSGLNITLVAGGFVLILLVGDRKWRFRYRPRMSPHFLFHTEKRTA